MPTGSKFSHGAFLWATSDIASQPSSWNFGVDCSVSLQRWFHPVETIGPGSLYWRGECYHTVYGATLHRSERPCMKHEIGGCRVLIVAPTTIYDLDDRARKVRACKQGCRVPQAGGLKADLCRSQLSEHRPRPQPKRTWDAGLCTCVSPQPHGLLTRRTIRSAGRVHTCGILLDLFAIQYSSVLAM